MLCKHQITPKTKQKLNQDINPLLGYEIKTQDTCLATRLAVSWFMRLTRICIGYQKSKLRWISIKQFKPKFLRCFSNQSCLGANLAIIHTNH